MKTMIAIVAAAAGIATLSPAAAEPLAPRPVTEAAMQDGLPAPNAKAQRICIVDNVTGSRIQRRECRTREQWEARDVQLPANL